MKYMEPFSEHFKAKLSPEYVMISWKLGEN